MLEKLPDDILSSIYEFQSVEDFAILTSLNRTSLKRNRIAQNLMWIKHIAREWKLSEQFVKSLLLSYTFNYRLLYPFCSNQISGLVAGDNLVECRENFATYQGIVGESNRSVQSLAPFPTAKNGKRFTLCDSISNMCYSMVEALNNSKLMNIHYANREIYNRYHSIPIAVSSNFNRISYCITPRKLAYYEVTIRKCDDNGLNNNINNELNNFANNNENNENDDNHQFECIAVGLATKYFLKHKRLPGWDHESYGYHGDDGAIFHGKGKQLASFGPTFGYNDTVGCGYNYHNHTIFFTLNGSFLGTAFTDIPKEMELFPTVGIDAHCTVEFNFGLNAPFKFNLLRFCHEFDLFYV